MGVNKVAQSEEWNSAYYDLYIDISSIPKNIDFKDIPDLQNQISKYHSIAKKIMINVSNAETEDFSTNKFIIVGKPYIKVDDNDYHRLY